MLLFQYLATAMLANPVRRTMCASLAMTPGQVAQASKVAQHTECEHVGTCPDIVLIQSTCGSSHFGGHPRAVGRNYANKLAKQTLSTHPADHCFKLYKAFLSQSQVYGQCMNFEEN